jgi:hypothetical protein
MVGSTGMMPPRSPAVDQPLELGIDAGEVEGQGIGGLAQLAPAPS